MNRQAFQTTNIALTEESFERLLRWLDADRARAGEMYEEIRLQLIKIFTARGCLVAEDLADETIDRVAKKTEAIGSTYEGNPALYFYGVARMVYLEYVREKRAAPPPPFPNCEEEEQRYMCLENCLERLTPKNRQLIIAYYGEDSEGKIDRRRALAESMEMEPNALWVRVHRLREKLRQCVGDCLQSKRQN